MKGCGCGMRLQAEPKTKVQSEAKPPEDNPDPVVTTAKRKRKVYRPRKRKRDIPKFEENTKPSYVEPDKKLAENESGNNYLVTTKTYKPLPNFILKKPTY